MKLKVEKNQVLYTKDGQKWLVKETFSSVKKAKDFLINNQKNNGEK